MTEISQYKILRNLDYLNRSMPVHLNIDLSGICNQKCVWCFFKGGIDENTDVMRDQELRKHQINTFAILDAIGKHKFYGGKAITFVGGGEPLIHPEALTILLRAILSNLDVGLVTNLSMNLSNNLKIAIASCEWVRVSLDASTPETYEYIHGKDHFHQVIENMKSIRPKTLGISFLVHQDNYRDIRGIFKIAEEVEADYIQFKPVYQNKEELKKLPQIADVNLLIDTNRGNYKGKVLNQYGSRVAILKGKDRNPITMAPYPHVPCQISKYRVHIGSDGNVYPCCIFKYSEEYSYGSIYNKPLLAVLDSQQRKDVDSKLFIDKCPQCWDKDCQQKLNEISQSHNAFV